MDSKIAHKWSEFSLFQKTLSLFLIAINALGIYGIIVDFIPSSNADSLGRIVSIILCLFLIFFIAWYGRTRLHLIFKGKSKFNQFIVILLSPIFLWFCIYLALTHGIFSVATYISGNTIEITNIGNIEHSFAKGCDYRFKSVFLDSAFPPYICFDGTVYAYTKNNVRATFMGVNSNFGMIITKIKSVEPLTSGSSGSENTPLRSAFAAH